LPSDLIGDIPLPTAGMAQNSFSIPAATTALEKELMTKAIAYCNGNKAKAAKLL